MNNNYNNVDKYLSTNTPHHPIKAKLIAHSISPTGIELYTIVVEQPKILNAEVNTHRVFSRNGSSSRAINMDSVLDSVINNPFIPKDVRLNAKGMQGYEKLPFEDYYEFIRDVLKLRDHTVAVVKEWKEKYNIHKQTINRYLEPFMMQKFLISTTEIAGWERLRTAEDAQPEIRILAKLMMNEIKKSTPKPVGYGEWHLPFIDNSKIEYTGLYPDEALISAGRVASISYRKEADIEAAKNISKKLLKDRHMSPFESQATPLLPKLSDNKKFKPHHLAERLDGSIWGGNFRGWGQLRGIVDLDEH